MLRLLGTALGLTEPGAVGGPVKSSRGWHVIRLNERIAAKQHPFGKVELQAKIATLKHKRGQTMRQFRGELEQMFGSTADPRALEKVRSQIPTD